jgi:hypothetical protein
MREIGTKGATTKETVKLFSKVTEKTGGSAITQLEIDELIESKNEELEYYKKALAKKAEEELKAAAR